MSKKRNRREFSRALRVEIVKRATRTLPSGVGYAACEKCNMDTRGWFIIDHIIPEGIRFDKSVKLTAEDGQLLCLVCNQEKTAIDKADIARAQAREASHLGARCPKQTFPSRPSNLRGPERAHEGRASLPPKELFR